MAEKLHVRFFFPIVFDTFLWKTEDEVVGWHHQLNGHEFGQTPGDGEGKGSLACCSPWGHKESDTTKLRTELTPQLIKILLDHKAMCNLINQ